MVATLLVLAVPFGTAQAAEPASASQASSATGLAPADLDSEILEAMAAFGTAGSCASLTAGSVATLNPVQAVAAAGACGIGVGRYLGKANIWVICTSSRQWWGYVARAQVRAMTFGKYSRC